MEKAYTDTVEDFLGELLCKILLRYKNLPYILSKKYGLCKYDFQEDNPDTDDYLMELFFIKNTKTA